MPTNDRERLHDEITKLQYLLKEVSPKRGAGPVALINMAKQYSDCFNIIFGSGGDPRPLIGYDKTLSVIEMLQRNLPDNQRARVVVDLDYDKCQGTSAPDSERPTAIIRGLTVHNGDYSEPDLHDMGSRPDNATRAYFDVYGQKWSLEQKQRIEQQIRQIPDGPDRLGQVVELQKQLQIICTPSAATDADVVARVNTFIQKTTAVDPAPTPTPDPSPTPTPTPTPTELPLEDPSEFGKQLLDNQTAEDMNSVFERYKLPGEVDPSLGDLPWPPPPLGPVDPNKPDSNNSDLAPVGSGGTRGGESGSTAVSESVTEAPGVNVADLLEQYQWQMLRATRGLRLMVHASLGTPLATQPSPYCPGPPETHFQINPDALRGLDQKPLVKPGYPGAFNAILTASPELAKFYAISVEAGYDETRIYETSLLFGRYRHPDEGLATGDLVYVANPMAADGGAWGVVITAVQREVTEALVSQPSSYLFSVRSGAVGVVSKAWNPTPSKIVADDSPSGCFWGPMLTRLRELISGGKLYYAKPNEVFGQIFGNCRVRIRNIDDLLQMMSAEIFPVDAKTDAWPTSILLGKAKGDIGVLLSDRRIFGLSGTTRDYYTWDEFGPRYIWYPRP